MDAPISTAFVFPGQGSQKIGMSVSLISAYRSGENMVRLIESVTSCPVLSLINNGPIERLTETRNAQIAIFATSYATLHVLKEEFGFSVERNVSFMAGHSLGEYTALCAASVMSVEDTAKLVLRRGELMGSAANDECSMCAIIGMNYAAVVDLLEKYDAGDYVVAIANDNSNTQVVVSGHTKAVQDVADRAKKAGAKNAIFLNTSGAFHCKLMSEAAFAFDSVLGTVEMHEPSVPVVLNFTGTLLDSVNALPAMLLGQMVGCVRWRECVNYMVRQGVKRIVEIGESTVLTKMAKRDYPDLEMINLGTVLEIEKFMRIR